MKNKFIKRILLLLIPIALYYTFPTYVLLLSKELYRFDHWATSSSYLIGNVYRDSYKEYSLKLASVNSFDNLDVLILGSSRGLQIRKEFFKDNTTFYNASKSASGLGHLRYLLAHTSNKTKINQIVILLDQWWFNENLSLENDFSILHKKYFNESLLDTKDVFVSYSSEIYSNFLIKKDLELNKLQQVEKDNITKIGINAIFHNEGYRDDGSYRYGRLLEGTVARDAKYAETFNRVKKGLFGFSHGKHIGKHQLEELNKLLTLCKERNINVIGILPPFSPKLNKLLKTHNQNFQYMNNLNKEISELFSEKKYVFFDYSVIDSLKIDNIENNFLIDPYHGSEIIYSGVLLDLAKQVPSLKKSLNVELLTKKLSTPKELYLFED